MSGWRGPGRYGLEVHGHSHSHDRHRWLHFPLNRTGRLLGIILLVALVVTIVGMVLLWPREDIDAPASLAPAGVDRVKVTVIEVEETACTGAPPDSPAQCVSVRFDAPDGNAAALQLTPSVSTPEIEAGDRILVADQGDLVEEQFRFFFLDFQRERSLTVLFLMFGLAVIIVGRLQGVRSLLALALSFVVLATFTLPALLETDSPVLVAIAGSAAVAIITLFLTHGLSHLTSVALLGSLVSLAITGFLAWIFVGATSLTGLSDENALLLVFGNEEIQLQGVLLAGMIIGTIGVLDDVTVTQAAAVEEIHEADPRMRPRQLYLSALRVGRDHIGSTTNTLFFAYAGAALPMLLLFTQAELSLSTVVTSEIVAIEVVRALVGGIGLVCSVPITTGLAAWVVRERQRNSLDVPDVATPAID